jgi:sporulation protein YlmC with PRC-barrel domain
MQCRPLPFRPLLLGLAIIATMRLTVAPPAAAQEAAMPADDLVGLEIIGSRGEELGQIAAVTGTADGGDAMVLVEASGMLDVGSRYFTVRWSQLAHGEDADALTYQGTAKDVLQLIGTDTQVAGR